MYSPATRSGFLLLVAALAATLGACGEKDLLGPDARQGIEGLVLIGPQCPVQSLEEPCLDLPYEADIDVRTASGSLVTRVRSGTDGRFRVGLRPGSYVLDPQSGDPFPAATSLPTDVTAGRYTEVLISFDTGIR